MSKKKFIQIHTALIYLYKYNNPTCTDAEAYNATANQAADDFIEYYEDQADQMRDRDKEILH